MGNLVDFLKDNFFHVAPILLAGGFAVAIILERTKALLWSYPISNPTHFFEKLRDLVMADRLAEALALCEQYRSKPLAGVVKAGLLRAHQPEALIEDGVEIALSEATEKIQVRTTYLATIANVSTLLGLLGTIVGLIHSFEAVGSANAQQRSALLAAGISTAMNATMLGLAVAIPCMVAFSFLMNKTNKLTTELDQGAMKMLDLIRQRYYDAETEPFSDNRKRAG
ncbi:MAG: MotA/TolQ/ExbB proton channel family protein [Bdellovibrionota bacterium]